jgi:mono/diheme cytochrome c family protein
VKAAVPFCLLWFALLSGASAADGLLPAPASHPVDFRRDIRPLFAERCHTCHGAEKQKGGLRLDRKTDALAGGDSGKVIIPGKSAESLLIKNVTGLDPDNIMPPKGKGEPLTKTEIGLLRAWIDAGAPWPDEALAAGKSTHWAFQPPIRPDLPQIKNREWLRNPIDRFVLARLERENITPSPEADRATLIRRLSLDLIGLPPKPEEVDAFVNDPNPDAYEALVDKLLSSPHFGERWGRHWLDLARYADSDGYEKDGIRPYAYLYRDWVINAINDDLPFDQFTIEQLAGDLIAGATLEQKTATGFHRQTHTNKEGGVDQEEFRCKATVDRANTTATVWLGLTLGCAECHTHKYDPITQREFYQFYAFFNNATEKEVPAPRRAELAAYERQKSQWQAEHTSLKERLQQHLAKDFAEQQSKWERVLTQQHIDWVSLTPGTAESAQGATLAIGEDAVVSASGKSPANDTYTVEVSDAPAGISGFKLEVLSGDKGPGRAPNGNFLLSEFRVKLVNAKGESTTLALTNAVADAAQPEHSPGNAIDGNTSTGWSVPPGGGNGQVATFETIHPVAGEGKLVFSLVQQYGSEHTLAKFRLLATTSAPPFTLVPMAVAKILTIEPSVRSDEQRKDLARFYREEIEPQTVDLKQLVAAHVRKEPKYPATAAAVLLENEKPRATHVHIRGDFLRKGDEVRPGTLSVLHPLKAGPDSPDRLGLARWLFAAENPLTSRVTVNHVWKHLFGRGLVATVDDFGARGEKPSHPELLDWLATEFPHLGWSRKSLIRLIVTSSTYRQASQLRPELTERDPNNILLARQSRLRFEAEAIRDAHLAVSGLLNPEIGGPSVRPPLPADVTSVAYANQIRWKNSEGPDKYRRGLYTFFQRTVPYPMLMTFDAPDSNVACTRRERSNTPLQALTLLNDPVFFECAQATGRSVAALPESDTKEKVRQLFTRCLSRPPTQGELDRLVHFHEVQSRLVKASPFSARALTGMKDIDEANFEAATFVALARTLMNLDEFVTRE